MREALAVPGCVVELFATESAGERHADLLNDARAGSVPVWLCEARAIDSIAGSVTPQGLVAVCRFVDVPLETAVGASARLVAVGAHLRDPGNAGSLVRCADAAGADAVVLAGSTVDPYNDKAVRSSAGSLFHLPIVLGTTVPEVVRALQSLGFLVLAATAGTSLTLDDLRAREWHARKVAWVFGNEAWGIPDDEAGLADESVAVPIYGRAESLNVATAAAVCLYATAWAQRDPRRG